jgi:hypothetical protein
MSSKYGNRKTVVDGIAFDSRAEARRYEELRLLEQAGLISGLQLQPRYILLEGFRDATGKPERAITYTGDFQYREGGRTVVEDVKGKATDVYKLKRKLFKSRYPQIEFREVEAW